MPLNKVSQNVLIPMFNWFSLNSKNFIKLNSKPQKIKHLILIQTVNISTSCIVHTVKPAQLYKVLFIGQMQFCETTEFCSNRVS